MFTFLFFKAKLIYFSLVLREREENKTNISHLRSCSWMKLRFINYLTRPENPPEVQGSRFGSCNEFTLGINQNNENIETSSVGAKQNSGTPNP